MNHEYMNHEYQERFQRTKSKHILCFAKTMIEKDDRGHTPAHRSLLITLPSHIIASYDIRCLSSYRV